MSESRSADQAEILGNSYFGSSEIPDPEMSSNDTYAARILPGELLRPEETLPSKIQWQHVIVLTTVHLISLLAFIPWLFTWSGLVVAIIGHFVFGMLGITIGYHRLLTHRGFTCPKWLEYSLATMGMFNLQDSPARWVAIHRIHHRFSDQQADTHSPLVSFFWGHVGWVLMRHKDTNRTIRYARFVPDLLRDPYYRKLERKNGWFLVFLAHSAVIIAIGAIYGYVAGGASGAIHYAASWAVWGIAVRTVFVLHGTWSVNSLTHLYGYRNYETRDQSTNNWLVALIAHGEGWHNNHHADPRSAAHGHRWWEFDMSWWVIRLLESLGLAKNVVRPSRR
ncbi:MAG: fatty acid desaturase [Lysobacterales bacterium]